MGLSVLKLRVPGIQRASWTPYDHYCRLQLSPPSLMWFLTFSVVYDLSFLDFTQKQLKATLEKMFLNL